MEENRSLDSSREIVSRILEILRDLGLENPRIIDARISDDRSIARIIVETYSDKSALISRGRIPPVLARELGVREVTIESLERIEASRIRLEASLKEVSRLEGSLWNVLGCLIRARMKLKDLLDLDLPRSEESCCIALSGGSDSTATLILARRISENPLALTVDPGSMILPERVRERISKIVEKLGVEHEFLDLDLSDIVERALSGRIHPCGRCHERIRKRLVERAEELGIEAIFFGYGTAFGRYSIRREGSVYVVALPSLLSLSKFELRRITNRLVGDLFVEDLGCPLHRECLIRNPHLARYSIQRILRELDAGFLSIGEALDSIVKIISWLSARR